MGRRWVCGLLACIATTAAHAQEKRVLDAPQLTVRPQADTPVFTGQLADVVVGWRPVVGAKSYRVAFSTAGKAATLTDTTEVRLEKKDVALGTYNVTVTALDGTGTLGTPSEVVPLTVVEVHAIPPGAGESMAPQRGAYAVGTRFSVADMHCELSDAPVDDLISGPPNELRVATAGLVTLRCASRAAYLEKQVVIAPVTVAAATSAMRGALTTVHVTIASVAYLGEHLDVEAVGDFTLGDAARTSFGFDVPVSIPRGTTSAALSIQTGNLELGRVQLALIEAPPEEAAPPPTHVSMDWRALDLGGHAGAFLPPDGRHAPTIGHPTNPNDSVSGGPIVGLRLGLFPTKRVGIEVEETLIEAGRADESGSSHILSSRVQIAVRAVEHGLLGLRVLAGTGAFTNLVSEGTLTVGTQGEVHAGAALTVETSPNLWLRFQFLDEVTTARDDGYAHCLELQLGVVTRIGRHDAW